MRHSVCFSLKLLKLIGFHRVFESLKQTDSFLLVFISQIKDLITICTNLFFFMFVWFWQVSRDSN